MRALLRALSVSLLLWLTLPAAALLLSAPEVAHAQSTGGSFGGGSFGGGGGSSSYGGGSSSYGSGGGGGEGSLGGAVCGLVILVFAYLFVAFFGGGGRPAPGSKRWEKMDVTAVRLGIDWRSRAKVQGALKKMAERGDTKSPRGLARLMHETATLLQEVEVAWLYAGVSNYSPMSPPQAEGIFRQLGIKARSRFKEEVVRSFEGDKEERQASALEAKAHEGAGVVVVTLIVAARREIQDLKTTTDAQEIRRALARLTHIGPSELVALEVVWSPAEEEDRMSTLELEALYPDLSLLDPSSIAGRVLCGFCGGPYAAELERCPHCGAEREPNKGRKSAKSTNKNQKIP